MTEDRGAAYDGRLRSVAVALAMPLGPGVDEAIALAEDLVADGLSGPATVEVASLPRGATRGDAEPAVREMLAEHGIEVPEAANDSDRYRFLLTAFGFWELPLHLFEGPFYARLLAWADQDPLDRALVTLLHERDLVSGPEARLTLEQEMRATVRAHIQPD